MFCGSENKGVQKHFCNIFSCFVMSEVVILSEVSKKVSKKESVLKTMKRSTVKL